MKARMKKLMAAGIAATMLMANCVPVFAETDTFEGNSITYTNTRPSTTSARATTVATNAYDVYVKLSIAYTVAGNLKTKAGESTGLKATSITVNADAGGTVNYSSSYHKARIYVNSILRTWDKVLENPKNK